MLKEVNESGIVPYWVKYPSPREIVENVIVPQCEAAYVEELTPRKDNAIA